MTAWTIEVSIGVAYGDAIGVQGSRQDLVRTLHFLCTARQPCNGVHARKRIQDERE